MSSPAYKSVKKDVLSASATVVKSETIPNFLEHQECANSINPTLFTEAIVYPYNKDEKIIPGYNYQSLFRKKSHLKLAKKKIK